MEFRLKSLVLCPILCVAGAFAQNEKLTLDLNSTQKSANILFETLQKSTREATGNLERQNVKLVFAFSTGHFAQDPGMAEAARAIGSSLVERHLVAGDKVWAYAWEMNLWDHPGASGNPYTLEADRPSDTSKAAVNALWPRSPQSGSAGGHDTEKAIAQLVEKVGNSSDTVLVLLTNTAYSVASRREKPVGDNFPGYKTALERFKRLPARTSSGASLGLPFKELTGGRERSLDAVILVPLSFSGTSFSNGSRSERLATAQTVPSSSGFPWWLVALGGLGIGSILAWVLRRKSQAPSNKTAPRAAPKAVARGGKDWTLEVEGRSLALPVKGEVCRLYRAGYSSSDERAIVLTEAKLPLLLATLERTPLGLEVRPDEKTRLVSINGQPAVKRIVALQGGTVRLRFTGKYQAKPGLPDQPFTHDIILKLVNAPLSTPSPR